MKVPTEQRSGKTGRGAELLRQDPNEGAAAGAAPGADKAQSEHQAGQTASQGEPPGGHAVVIGQLRRAYRGGAAHQGPHDETGDDDAAALSGGAFLSHSAEDRQKGDAQDADQKAGKLCG